MTPAATERDLEMLAWLAERDLEAVAHAHKQFLAATEPEAVASLGRTYQKVSRCLRSTLALKMKAAEAQAEQAHAAAGARFDARRAALVRDAAIEARTLELQDAVERVACAAIPDPEAREERLEAFDEALDDWIEAPDYLTADLDAQVAAACRLLDLPEDLAATWRKLPVPMVYPEGWDDEAPEGDGSPQPPWRESG